MEFSTALLFLCVAFGTTSADPKSKIHPKVSATLDTSGAANIFVKFRERPRPERVPVDNKNNGGQTNVSGDPTANFVSASAEVPVRFRLHHAIWPKCVQRAVGHNDVLGILTLKRCNRLDSQQWVFIDGLLKNQEIGKCMEMKEDGSVIIAHCDPIDPPFLNQRWESNFEVGFTGQLINLGQNKCVERRPRDHVFAQPCSDTIEQQWERIPLEKPH